MSNPKPREAATGLCLVKCEVLHEITEAIKLMYVVGGRVP